MPSSSMIAPQGTPRTRMGVEYKTTATPTTNRMGFMAFLNNINIVPKVWAKKKKVMHSAAAQFFLGGGMIFFLE